AVGGAADLDRGERIAIEVGVVAEQAAGAHRHGDVLADVVAVVRGDGGVVADGEGDGGGVAAGAAVAGVVGEAVAAHVAGGGRVAEGAVGGQCGGAVARANDELRCQSIAVRVGVIGQHARRGDGERVVVGNAVAVVDGHGRLVGDIEGNRGAA